MRKTFLFCFSAMLVMACGNAQQKAGMAVSSFTSLPLYNLAEPEVVTLPVSLNEISGLTFHVADNAVFAVDDEQGSLFKIKLLKEPVVEQRIVGLKNDYEGVALVDNTFYLLSSPGAIVYFPDIFPVTKTAQAVLPLKGRNEFEILFKDPAANRLLMMCKSCRGDRKDVVSVYAFNLAAKNFDEKPVAQLQVKEIEKTLQERVGTFKPSAANVHPLTGDIYIISSINQLLVVTDRNFNVKEVHKLQTGLFKQPEGLCFTPTGELLISNEAAGKGNANILIFRQRQ